VPRVLTEFRLTLNRIKQKAELQSQLEEIGVTRHNGNLGINTLR